MINKITETLKLHILKLKGLKYSTFRTCGLKTQENRSDVRPYFIALSLIALAVSVFYYFYLKYYGGFYAGHYSEYYTRAVVIADFLMKLDLSSALTCYFNSFVDKILVFRSVPFLLLFGPSQFVFFYSNVFFNLLLLIILFHSLLKIMQPDKAFSLTLFILSQYFFIELLASFYVDLSFFLICSIFFIYLSLFDKNPKKYNLRLIFIVFMIFLIKNASYLLFTITSPLFIIYSLITKKQRMVYISRFLIIVACGFFIFYLIAFKCNAQRFFLDVQAGIRRADLAGTDSFIFAAYKIFASFRLFSNYFLVDKFPVFWLNIIIYQVVIFVAYKKRELFWIFLFFVSEIFYFVFFNISGSDFEYRHFLTFYFIYFYFIYEFIREIFIKIFPKRSVNKFYILLSLIFFLASFDRLTDTKSRILYSIPLYNRYDCIDDFSRYLPVRTKLYIADDMGFYRYLYLTNLIDEERGDYSYLAGVEPRFRYKIVKDVKNADYIMGKDYLKRDHKGGELITTPGTVMGKYYLLKIK